MPSGKTHRPAAEGSADRRRARARAVALASNGRRQTHAPASGGHLRAVADRPIGVFDSGIGGLTVLKALVDLMPNEDFIYLGDTARLPYGTKSNEIIVRYSRENTEFLLAKGIKMLVVACNTASAVALDEIQRATIVPVIGVIEPGASAAAKASRSGKIGVIGTEATIGSGAYTRTIQRFRPKAEIYTRACPMLVPLVEEGWTDNDIAERTVACYLESLKASGIDTLLLGCTHYPLLLGLFQRVLGKGVRIVDSATATAKAVQERLRVLGVARHRGDGSQRFFVTETPDRFVRVGRRFLGPQVESAVRIER
jgi:glutamate racemase